MDNSLILSSKMLHDLNNKLTSILGYSEILCDEDSLAQEQIAMAQSIRAAALNMQTWLTPTQEQFQEIKEELSIKPSATKKKVLIVDDNEDNRAILEYLLKQYPLEIFCAENGLESIKIANEHKPDLIFMDLNLPDILGSEASKIIKENSKSSKIIALTGDVCGIEKEMQRSEIFDLCLLKPFDRKQIKSIIEALIYENSQAALFLEENESPKQRQHNSYKILIVDDRPENISLFQTALRPFHYDLRVATNGISALRIVQEFHPDLILLDIVMPQMNGYAVLHELKKNRLTREIPVIFLTAKDTTEEIVKGFEAGAVDYVAKPFHPKELIARIQTHLQKASLLASLKRLMEHSFHELYTPLSVIASAMQIQELQYQKTDYTQMTLAACKTLQNIYDDLYYSINYINDEKEKICFDLSELVEQRINYFTLVAQSHHLGFEIDLVSNALVKRNQKEMERVFDNLISNALKYTKENNKIIVSIKENGDFWSFRICNPIEKDIDVTKIFHKYYRHDEEVFGHGLGLDLVESICVQNEIQIDAQIVDNLFCITMEIAKIV